MVTEFMSNGHEGCDPPEPDCPVRGYGTRPSLLEPSYRLLAVLNDQMAPWLLRRSGVRRSARVEPQPRNVDGELDADSFDDRSGLHFVDGKFVQFPQKRMVDRESSNSSFVATLRATVDASRCEFRVHGAKVSNDCDKRRQTPDARGLRSTVWCLDSGVWHLSRGRVVWSIGAGSGSESARGSSGA